MKSVHKLTARMRRRMTRRPLRTVQDLGMDNIREVRELQPQPVMREIEGIFAEAVQSILAGEGFSYDVPNRGAGNQEYIPELDRIVLKDKVSTRPFASTSSVRKTVRSRFRSGHTNEVQSLSSEQAPIVTYLCRSL